MSRLPQPRKCLLPQVALQETRAASRRRRGSAHSSARAWRVYLRGPGNSTRNPVWGVCGSRMNSKRVKKRKTTARAAGAGRASPVDSVIRAVDAFRRGKAVLINEGGTSRLAFAVETLDRTTLGSLKRTNRALHLVLTHARAQTLKIRLYTPKVVALEID